MQNRFFESIYFFQQFLVDFHGVGAIAPTSPYAGQAMSDELARHMGQQRRILEVGSGTGAISAEIIPHMQPGDELHLCEINPELVQILRQRVATTPLFALVRSQIFIYEHSILELKFDQPFDVIISSLPFNSLPLEFTQAVIEQYRQILAEDGTFTYIEYIGGRTLKNLFTSSAEARAIQTFLSELQQQHECRREVVVRNLPPAWIHHLRLASPPPSAAQTRRLTPREQVGWGAVRFDRDIVPFVLATLGAAKLIRRRWLAALALPVALFFRDPPRTISADTASILAAGDGRVMKVETVHDARFGDGEWCRIVVFLSILDVHVNRSPVAGSVVERVSQPGGYALANSAEADHNVAEYTVLETIHGRCVVAQRVGAIARRLVNRAPVGSLLAQGEKFGLMRFGSRIDLYLPIEAVEPMVTVGQIVRGGITPIARWKDV